MNDQCGKRGWGEPACRQAGMPDIKNNIEIIREKISAACRKSGRSEKDVILLAATKDVPAEYIEQAIEAGITHIGENRVQEAETKYERIKSKYPQVSWHMIGHLQTNKVKTALQIFDMIESVDSLKLASEISNKASNITVPVLIEVNVSGEGSKFGVPEPGAIDLIKSVSGIKNLSIKGLMTVPPAFDDAERARSYFKKLKLLSGQIAASNIRNIEMKYLSMGMSDDFFVAVEEGSNIIRVGRGIFGIEHKH